MTQPEIHTLLIIHVITVPLASEVRPGKVQLAIGAADLQ